MFHEARLTVSNRNDLLYQINKSNKKSPVAFVYGHRAFNLSDPAVGLIYNPLRGRVEGGQMEQHP